MVLEQEHLDYIEAQRAWEKIEKLVEDIKAVAGALDVGELAQLINIVRDKYPHPAQLPISLAEQNLQFAMAQQNMGVRSQTPLDGALSSLFRGIGL